MFREILGAAGLAVGALVIGPVGVATAGVGVGLSALTTGLVTGSAAAGVGSVVDDFLNDENKF